MNMETPELTEKVRQQWFACRAAQESVRAAMHARIIAAAAPGELIILRRLEAAISEARHGQPRNSGVSILRTVNEDREYIVGQLESQYKNFLLKMGIPVWSGGQLVIPKLEDPVGMKRSCVPATRWRNSFPTE